MTTATAEKTVAPTAHRNRWLVLAVICIPVFVGSLDLTVVSAFLPELIIELQLPLQTALDDAAWILSGYLLAYTISLTFMGRVSDLVGRRTVYIACLLIFMVGSVLVATSSGWPTEFLYSVYRRFGQRPDIAYVNLQALIFGRVVQALGAGALVPVSLALVGDLFPAQNRARPLGVIGAVDTLGWVLGHLYGGVFVQYVHWHWLFWVNIPIALIALVLVVWALRGVPQIRAQGRFDFLGAALIIAALAALNIGLGANVDISASTGGFDELSHLPAYFAPMMVVFIVCFALFLLVESRVRDPLVNLGMFRRRNLSSGSLVNLFVGFNLVVGLVSVPILVNVRQPDATMLTEAALTVGLLLSTLTIPMALAAVPGGWWSDRIGYRRTTVFGLILAALGFAWIWQTWHFGIQDSLVAVQMAIIGVGLGLTFSPISAAVINAATESERGVASALVIILRLIGMTVAVSALTTISLQRVNLLAAQAVGVGVDPQQAVDTYAHITVQVLAELGLVGAVVCAIALIPALLLKPD